MKKAAKQDLVHRVIEAVPGKRIFGLYRLGNQTMVAVASEKLSLCSDFSHFSLLLELRWSFP